MPICKLCNKYFPNWKKIDGRNKNLQRRKYCLDCSPYKKNNTKKLDTVLTNDNRTSYGKKCVCSVCGKKYIYGSRKGHTLVLCNSCVASKYKYEMKEKAVKYKGGKCELCGYDKCIASLCFHHTDPSEKDFGIGQGYILGWEKLKIELDKCILLCFNCHCELHYTPRYNFPKKQYKQYICVDCKCNISKNGSIRCKKCSYKNKNKIVWPDTKILIEMVKKSSYTSVSKQLGVSNSSVKKRIKNHPPTEG